MQLAGSAGPKGGPERGPGQSAAKMMHLSALTLLLAQFSALLLSVGAAPMFDQVPPQGLIPNTEAPPVQQKPFVAYRRPGQKPKGKLYDNYPKTNWTSFLGGQRPTTKLAPNAPAQLRSVAYFPSWSYADVPLSTDVTSRLTHVVYAFMSMSYIGGRWYLDFINPDSETKICPAGGNCWDPSTSDQCLWLPPTSSCDGGRTIALSPRFGFSKCTWDTCWNKMDAWKSPPCQTTVQNGMCGQLGYLMKKVKSNPANKGIRFMLGVGGASHSNYFVGPELWFSVEGSNV